MDALEQAKNIADQILEMTKALVFSGEKEQEEDDVEAYAYLLEDREPLVHRLTALREEISKERAASEDFAAIRKVLDEIADLDKKHIAFMENLRNDAKESFKDVKQGQRIHMGYNPLPGNEVSSVFDVKQ